MTVDHIIFDLDGTLVDSVLVCADILDEMLIDRQHPLRVCRNKARDYISLGGAHMVAALLEDACGDPALEIVEFRRRYAIRPTPVNSLFDGVHSGLELLRDQGFRLAICSNKPQNLCEKVLIDLGLAYLFDAVVGSNAERRPKPAPDLMDETLAQLGVASSRCAFVGDSELDHAVAVGADMPFLFVTYGYENPEWKAPDISRHDTFTDVVDSIIDWTATRAVPMRQSLRTGTGS